MSQTRDPFREPLAERRAHGRVFAVHNSDNPEHPLQEPWIPAEFLAWHPRYDLGAPGQPRRTREEMEAEIAAWIQDSRRRLTLPVHCYEHGLIALRNEPYYGEPWSGSQIGAVSVRKADLRAAFGKKPAAELQEKGEEYLRQLTRDYGRYLNGDSEYLITEEPECPSCGQPDPKGRWIFVEPAEDEGPEAALERHIRENYPEPEAAAA